MSLKENKIRTNVTKILDCIEQCIEEADGKIKTSPAARLDFGFHCFFMMNCNFLFYSLCKSQEKQNEPFIKEFENQYTRALISRFSKYFSSETVIMLLKDRMSKYKALMKEENESDIDADKLFEQFIANDIYSDDIFVKDKYIPSLSESVSLDKEINDIFVRAGAATEQYQANLEEMLENKQTVPEEEESMFEFLENIQSVYDEPLTPAPKPQISNSLLYCLVAPILLAVMFGVGACDLPYGYYVFTRITTLVLCAIFMIAYTGAKEFLNFPNIAVLIIAILFNPIAPIYFEKFTWVILDIISSAIMLTVSAYIYVKDICR